MSRWANQVEALFEHGGAHGKEGRRKNAISTLQVNLLSNEEHLKGLDRAMQFSFGWSLDALEAEPRVKALAANEKRFFVAFEDLPAEIQEVSQGSRLGSRLVCRIGTKCGWPPLLTSWCA